MAIGIINSGLSGITAAQTGLATTSHNITNALTPGYNRQTVVQLAASATATGSGFIGQGTTVETVSRLYNQFLSNQVLSAQAGSNQLNTYYTQIQQISNMLGDSSTGVSPALQGFFSALQTAANNPSDAVSRQALLSAGTSLAQSFNLNSQQLSQMNSGVNNQISSTVASINSFAQQIAKLNNQIVKAQSNIGKQPANDLLDQRDQLINQLNQLTQTSVIQQSDGSSSVYIGSGQPLVLNSTSFALTTVKSATDPFKVEIGYSSPGSSVSLADTSFQGGSLAGLLAFRNESLDPARNTLGRIAITLADTFNQQHRLGLDATGALGGNFFNVAGPLVTASSGNISGASISATLADSNALTTSDYKLVYDGTNYTMTRLTDGMQSTFSGFPQTIDGVTLNLSSGPPAAGDAFLIQPTAMGAGSLSVAISDPRKVALAAPILANQSSGNIGSAQISAGVVNGPPPVNANLRQPVTITFSGANTYSVSGTGTGNPSGLAYVSGNSISYNGWTAQITGVPAAGDSFTVGPNVSGTSDNRNALLLAQLQTSNVVANSSMTYQSAYGDLVGMIGTQTQNLQNSTTAQAALVNQTTTAQQSFSGVNLDEEAANLMRYQQAYQASAKIIAVAGKLFDSILQLQ